jgi:ABC-2 type transport system ATP-binding protein
MENTIDVSHLTHRYAAAPVVNDLSFAVAQGEVVGLLGPNGAGKTTTVRLLNGLLKPASGSMRVLGLDPTREGQAVRRQTGVLTETPALYERLTARQNLAFFGTVSGMSDAQIRQRSTELLRFFDLQDRANDRAGRYSKGMKQRLALARALLNHPALLFLDEPTSGLDPESAQQVHELIRNVQQQEGSTVLLATHHLEEAERLCNRVAILNQGRLLAFGTLDELRQQIAPGLRVALRFYQPAPAGLEERLRALPGVEALLAGPAAWTAQVRQEAVVPEIVALLASNGARLLAVEPQAASLEEIYFTVQNRHNGVNHER